MVGWGFGLHKGIPPGGRPGVPALWIFWVQFVFGLSTFVIAVIMRFLRVYMVLRFQVKTTGWKTVWWYLGLVAPWIISSIVLSAFQVDGPVVNQYGMQVCYLPDALVYFVFGLLLVYLLMGLVSHTPAIQRLLKILIRDCLFFFFFLSRS